MFITMALRNISRRKVRSLIAILAIIISSSLYVSLDLLNRGATYSAINAYTEYLGDFDVLVTGSANNVFFNATNISNTLNNLSFVEVAAPRLIVGSLIVHDSSQTRAVLVGIDQELDSHIGHFSPLYGSDSISDYNGCLVLNDVASSLGVNIGDSVDVYFVNASGDISSTSIVIDGIVKHEGKLPINIRSAVFLRLDFLQSVFGGDFCNMVFIKLKGISYGNVDEAIEKMKNFAREIQSTLGLDYNVEPIKASLLYNLRENVESFTSLLMIFATVSLLMSIILIFSTINMNLHERIREIGIIRSIGGSFSQVFLSFIMESIILGIIGGLLGLFFGMIVYSDIFVRFFVPQGRLLLEGGLQLGYSTIEIAFVLGLASSVLGGIYPAYRAASLPPSEAISPLVRRVKFYEKIKKLIDPEAPNFTLVALGLTIFGIMSFLMAFLPVVSFLGKTLLVFMSFFAILTISIIGIILVFLGFLPSIVKRLDKVFFYARGLSVMLAKVNILREKRRAILVFFMISLAVSSILMIGFSLGGQVEAIKINVQVTQGSDLVVYSNEPIPLNYTSVIENITGVKYVAPISQGLPCKAGDLIMWSTESVKIYGIDPEAYYNASYLTKFSPETPRSTLMKLWENDTVIISRGLADKLDVSIGDSLRIEFGVRTYILKIVAILDNAPGFQFTRFKQKALSTDILVSFDTLKKIQGSKPYVFRYLIRIANWSNTTSIISEINDKIGSNFDIQIINTFEIIDNATRGMKQLETILDFMLYFAIIIAILGHITAITTSLYERIWEIGMLRAMGVGVNQVSSIYITETIILAVLGHLTGLISAYTVSLELNISSNLISEIPTPLVIPWLQILYTLIVVTIPATLITWLIVKRFATRNISTILRKASEI
ncbi:MAG: ABC transporter permease [Candidatus Njordarchaeia archaeon]